MPRNDICAMNTFIRRQYPEGRSEMIHDDLHGTVWHVFMPNGQVLRWTREVLQERMPSERVLQADPHFIPIIEAWLRSRHPDINNWEMNGNIVVYGLVQSGKTELILNMFTTQHACSCLPIWSTPIIKFWERTRMSSTTC